MIFPVVGQLETSDRKPKAFRIVRAFILAFILVVGATAGCGQLRYRLSNAPPAKSVPNPVRVPPMKDGYLWDQVTDTVDDFFPILKQQPVAASGGIIVDGRLETKYQIGNSLFEPWRKDSTEGFERLQSTLQSIRRRAIVTVRPAVNQAGIDLGPGYSQTFADGYIIEVVVTKDIEDVDRPIGRTGAAEVKRHDGTIVRQEDRVDDTPITLGWISLGRDQTLEQRILQQILGRIQTPKK